MIKSWKCNLKHLTSKEYEYLRKLCHLSKSVYNEALYNVRQHYQETKQHLSYEENVKLMVDSDNYFRLGSNVSQQTMRALEGEYKSYFSLLKLAKEGKYDITKVKSPHYKEKDGFYYVCFAHAGENSLKNGKFKVPISRILAKENPDFKMFVNIPKFVIGKKLRQIRIYPRCNGRYFEMVIIFDDEEPSKQELDSTKALAIDLGVNNLMTCATSDGKSFIIDGRKLKSINQWFNKTQARLSSIKDKQQLEVKQTKRQARLSLKRERRIQDYIYKSSKYVVNYCFNNNIGNLVYGYNQDFQQAPKLYYKKSKQNFVNIPFGNLKARLKYLCELKGIKFIEQEESYTSKASFWDNDFIPVYDIESTQIHQFSGKRVHRGQYKTSTGKFLNADLNGALNILRKSNVVDLSVLYASGTVNVPIRIRLA